MKAHRNRYLLKLGLVVAIWLSNGGIGAGIPASLIATAQAIPGRPLTPVSYAGVARRTTVRVATPGLGAPGVGVRPGVGVNLGGPVNRVGVR